jgi:hypothetical protein
MMIGSDMAGVMLTTDAGNTWVPNTDGLVSSDPSHRPSSYVQDICAVNYYGIVEYFAATVGGIYSRGASGWVGETSTFLQTWYNYNEEPTAPNYLNVDTAIPFSSLDWVEGTPVLVAGCGNNRWDDAFGANAYTCSNGWTGYPGCDGVNSSLVSSTPYGQN